MPVFMLPLFASFSWAARRRFSSALTILTILVVATVIGIAFGLATFTVMRDEPRILPRLSHPPTASMAAGLGVVFGIFMCAVWALAFVYPFAAEDARMRSLEAEKLKLEAEKLKLEAEKLRSIAELARLRTQLEPHFILNTLNAIAGLVTQEPREARRLIACLGDLLRDALRDSDEVQTLGAEIAWLQRYAEILESRHAGSLSFRWEVADDAVEVLLPRLLLQPLVENAVKHGALRRRGGGQVAVHASVTREGDGPARLVCTIEDNGPGMPASPPRPGAFGLRSVRRRIELKYADGGLRLDSSPEGTRAIVELPCHASRATPAPAIAAS
jgi:signal transduction histidine kinase